MFSLDPQTRGCDRFLLFHFTAFALYSLHSIDGEIVFRAALLWRVREQRTAVPRVNDVDPTNWGIPRQQQQFRGGRVHEFILTCCPFWWKPKLRIHVEAERATTISAACTETTEYVHKSFSLRRIAPRSRCRCAFPPFPAYFTLRLQSLDYTGTYITLLPIRYILFSYCSCETLQNPEACIL